MRLPAALTATPTNRASTDARSAAERFTAQPVPRLLQVNLVALMTGMAALLALVGAVLGYRWSEGNGFQRVAEIAAERLELYAATLESELGRLAHLPSLVAIDESVTSLFDPAASPADEAARRQAAESQLARLNARAGSLLIFAADLDGDVLASSEATPLPPARKAVLRQVARALQGQPYGFFAAGGADAGTDFYQAQSVQRDGRLLGWIVVRNNLGPLESTWIDLGVRSQSERLIVVDPNDVVILSSVPQWRYRPRAEDLTDSRAVAGDAPRYPEGALEGLRMTMLGASWQGAELVRVAGDEAPERRYLALERSVPTLGLRLVTLSDPSDVWRDAQLAAWGGGAAGGLVGVMAIYLLYRRRAMAQLFRARNALQAARDELEQQVHDRTRELRTANDELKRQIAQRLQVEDELLQAGKLAVLGQMSAGIAHEVNQPLTALQVLSSNTLRLLEAGRLQDVASNLQGVAEVVERMGRITRQLKTFARKADGGLAPVRLADAVSNALVLLGHRLRDGDVNWTVAVDLALRVRCDGTRLEQVLVNLIGNALDALQDAPVRRLRIEAAREGARVRVRVVDSGRGMSEAERARLFEPFFTTKPPGEGLGLGLVISSKIVREFGGTLMARAGSPGMVFEFDLEHAGGEQDV